MRLKREQLPNYLQWDGNDAVGEWLSVVSRLSNSFREKEQNKGEVRQEIEPQRARKLMQMKRNCIDGRVD